MGCWNHTCAISNLPVLYHEPVYVMLLLQQDKYDNLCYPTSFWKPLPFYFEGKYDDYGAVEECHGPMLNCIVNSVAKCLYEMEQGENKYHDIPVKREGFTIEKLFEADHENRLKMDHRFSTTKSTIKHIVIRKNVFDNLVAQYPLGYYDYDLKVRVKQTYEERFELVMSELLKELKEYDDTFFASLSEDDLKAFNTDDKILSYKMLSANITIENVFSKYLDNELIKYTPMYDVKRLLTFCYYEGHFDKLKMMVEQLTKQSILSMFMHTSRKMWGPPSGTGSQDTSTFSQLLLSNITIAEVAELKKRFDE